MNLHLLILFQINVCNNFLNSYKKKEKIDLELPYNMFITRVLYECININSK